MSNLSDLLPAGASAKQITATDSGSGISSKAPVILNSDGTVTEVSGTSASIGSATDPMAANAGSYNRIQGVQRQLIYDTTADRIILAANCNQSGANQQVRVVAGQVSGSTCTFGSSINIDSTETGTGINVPSVTCAICFDEDNGFPLVFVRSADSSYFTYPVLVPLVVSGSTISLGTPLVIESAASSANSFFCTYDTTNDKVLCVYGLSASTNLMRAAVVTVSSTSSLSVTGSPVSEPNSTAINQNWTLTYAPDADLHFFAGTLYSNKFIGTTIDISTGSAVWKTTLVELVTSVPTGGYYSLSTYDSTSQAIIATYYRTVSLSPEYTNDIVPVVLSGSGASTGMSVGTIGNTGTAVAVNYYGAPVYDPDKNVTGVTFNTSTGVSYVTATLTGVSPYVVSTTPATVMDSSSVNIGAYNVGVYDPDTDQICNIAGQNGNQGCIMYSPGSTNISAQSFVGIADSAISASAAGSIIVQGGTVTGVSTGTGLSMGATVQYSSSNLADIYASQAVFDSTNNKMVIVYDGAGSGAGYGIVGTISGTSVSYGSAVQYSGGNAHYSRAAYDSTNQRVVVAYRDTNNSNYGTAVVGTVSGTSISWGTPVAFESSAIFFTCVSFDSNEGKVVITWKNNSTAYATSIVGTVSGTSISFGSAVIIDTSYGYNKGSVTYDPNAQRHLYIAERTSGSVTESYVGTVSGTSISWGSAVSLTTTQYFYDSFSAYEAPSQKLGVVFTNASDSTLGTLVATISGSSVSYGTLVNVGAGAYTAPGIYYDATAAEFVAQGVLSSDLLAYRGTLSGTTISWGAAQTVAANADFGTGVGVPGYDTNAGKGLFQWANAGGTASDSGVATIGDLPLTVGTKYYVTTSGGFSSSADTPSVNAGLAISTTSLLLNGDS